MVDNIPEGYKRTDVGIIPEDWEVDIVKNISQITTGKRNTEDKIPEGQYPFFVRSQQVEKINSYSYDGEAVLTAGDGVGVGKVFHYVSGKFDFHQRVYKISDFKGVNGRYFYEYFKENFLSEVQKYTAKSSVDSVRMEMIAGMQMALPTPQEQQAIADVLYDIDILITSVTMLLVKKKYIKQGAKQKLLTGEKRLEGYNGRWNQVRLGDVLQIGHGKSQHNIVDINGKYPILATGGEIGRTNSFLYDKPSVLIGRKGTIDVPQYMETPFWTIDTLFYTKLSDGVNAKYIYYLFCMIDWLKYNEASGVPSLSAKIIETIEINLPKKDEQTAIAQILSDMDTEIENLTQKLKKYKSIKQAMMQELLTGKRRLI